MTRAGPESDNRDAPRESRLFLPSEVAELFRVSPKTVTRWARHGKLPYIQTLGGHRRFRREDIARALRGYGVDD